MLGNEFRGVRVRLGIEEIGDIPLLPQLNGLGSMCARMSVAHAREQIAQLLRFGMGQFYELKAVGSGGILRRDICAGRIVGKGAHGRSSDNVLSTIPAYLCAVLAKVAANGPHGAVPLRQSPKTCMFLA